MHESRMYHLLEAPVVGAIVRHQMRRNPEALNRYEEFEQNKAKLIAAGGIVGKRWVMEDQRWKNQFDAFLNFGVSLEGHAIDLLVGDAYKIISADELKFFYQTLQESQLRRAVLADLSRDINYPGIEDALMSPGPDGKPAAIFFQNRPRGSLKPYRYYHTHSFVMDLHKERGVAVFESPAE